MDHERLARLTQGFSRARRDLAAQDEALQRLKARLTTLELSLTGAERRLAEIAQKAPALPPRRPALWTRLVPCAALTAVGLLLAQAARSKPAPRAWPAPLVNFSTAALEPPLIPEEEAAARAIALVLAYRPRGARACVEEILSPELASSVEGEGSPWAVTHLRGLEYLVSFRPYGTALENAPLYEFETDLGTGAVSAGAETELALTPGF